MMFERSFASANNRCFGRGSRRMANTCACAHANHNICLLSLDIALAVSIFAALRLIVIRLIGLVISGVIVPGAVLMRPPLASAY